MIDDRIQSIEIPNIETSEEPIITKVRYIDSENGVFTNVWAVADTDGCGDPDCGCHND